MNESQQSHGGEGRFLRGLFAQRKQRECLNLAVRREGKKGKKTLRSSAQREQREAEKRNHLSPEDTH